jgi:CubicO group peptidase (beta-lactamase class C family)
MRFALLTAVTLLIAPAPAGAQQAAPADPRLAGSWDGAMETPGGAVGFGVVLEAGPTGWTGTFSLPAENVRDVPLASVEAEGDSVVMTIVAGRVLHARLEGDSLTGVARLADREMPLVLVRAGTPAAQRLAARIAASVEAARAAPMTPAATGPGLARVDPDALARLVRAAGDAGSHALVVLHDGELVGAWHAAGQRRRIEAMSATKSVVNLAVGRLLTTGALASIDTPISAFYPEWAEGPKSGVTVRHLLNHTSGLHSERSAQAIYASEDFVRFALDADLTAEPGTEIVYNNSATNLLAGVVGKAAGRRMDLFLRDDLFAHLGITDFGWSLDDAGNPHGMAGLQIHAEDLARLGQLVLDRGEWEGERLIDASWFDLSMAPGSELAHTVGLLWWLIRDDAAAADTGAAPAADADAPATPGPVVGYRADGYLGQYLVVYPRERLVGVRMVAQSPAYDPATDGFQEFQALLRALVTPTSP